MWSARRGRSLRFFTTWAAISGLVLTMIAGCRIDLSDASGSGSSSTSSDLAGEMAPPTRATGSLTSRAAESREAAARKSRARVATPAPTVHPTATTPMPTKNPKGWKSTYADNFNGPLNTGNAWSIYDTPGTSNPTTSWYATNHVLVGGGQLHINGYVDKAAQPDGRVVTGGLGLWKRPQKYGKWEMLVRMDPCTDVKYAWLLWPFSDKWPAGGEVDFAEDEGGDRALTTATLIYAAPDGSDTHLPQDYATPTPNFSAWHEIGLEWTPKSIRYTLDGQYWGTPKTTHLPPTPMVFVLQTEGKVPPSQVNLPGGSCNAQVGWVVQYKMA